MRSRINRSGNASKLAFASVLLVVITVLMMVNVSTSSDGENNDDLYIVEQPSDQFIHDRTNAVFTVTAIGSGNTYQWEYYDEVTSDWISVDKGEGAETDMLVISSTDYPDGTSFRCVVKNNLHEITSQSADLYTTTTSADTSKDVHYVTCLEDLYYVGTGKMYKGTTWDLNDTYIQTADIDFTDTNNKDTIEEHIAAKERVSISYSTPGSTTSFTLKESYGGSSWFIANSTEVYYNFGLKSGKAEVGMNGTFSLDNDFFEHNDSPTVFSIGGVGSNGPFAISIEIGTGLPTSKESYRLGNFIPIGEYTNSVTTSFSGLYDGRGYSIIGMETALYNAGASREYSGMFAYLTGTLQNIHLENGSSTAISTNNEVGAGSIAGISNGSIFGSYNTGIVGSNKHSGGIVAQRIGSTDTGEIRDCYNTGTIGGNYSGGIAGETFAKITNCYNTGNVVGGESAGGIAAFTVTKRGIINSYNTGTVIGGSAVGGVLSMANPSPASEICIIDGCYNSGDVYLYSGGTIYNYAAIGGIFGYAHGNVSVYDCQNTGKITVLESYSKNSLKELYVGGIAGYVKGPNQTDPLIERCYNIGMIEVNFGTSPSSNEKYTRIGGIAGCIADSALGPGIVLTQDCYNLGDIDVTFNGMRSSEAYVAVGGIVGVTDGNVSSSFNEGKITVLNNHVNRTPYVGGIIGTGDVVSESSNRGNISVTTLSDICQTGGIAGTSSKEILNCYNTGSVKVTKGNAAGIVAGVSK